MKTESRKRPESQTTRRRQTDRDRDILTGTHKVYENGYRGLRYK